MADNEIDLEAALDGLMTAARYSEQEGHEDLCYLISHLYQLLGDRELGEKEWLDSEDESPLIIAKSALRIDDSSYEGDMQVESWQLTAINTDSPVEKAGVFVEFWDTDDDEVSGEFYFPLADAQSLILDLLRSLNREMHIDGDTDD